jgi:hypothetical protein
MDLDFYVTERVYGRGEAGVIHEATSQYTAMLQSLPHSRHIAEFAVKVIRSNHILGYTLVDKVELYDRMNHLPHILPLLHWVAFLRDGTTIDPSSDRFDLLREPDAGCYMIILTFERMHYTLAELDRVLTPGQRKDACLQMIHMIRSLHAIDIAHNDFHMGNIMGRKQPDGSYIFKLIDFELGHHDDDGLETQPDYDQLVENIALLLTGEYPCEATHPELAQVLETFRRSRRRPPPFNRLIAAVNTIS